MSPSLERDDIKTAVKGMRRSRAPDGLWEDILRDLRQPSPVPTRPLLQRPVRSRSLAAAAVLAALVVGTSAGLYRLYHAPSQWAVVPLAGTPTLDGGALASSGNIVAGQWLMTDSTSRAQLEVGRIGTAEIGPNSRVRMVSGGNLEHRLSLVRGTLDAVITAPPRLFFVETPTALATDLGCAYTLRVDERGNTRLHVTVGWVELKQDERVSMVPAGMIAEVEAGNGPGTPYPTWLSEEARTALARIDRDDGTVDDLNRVLDDLDTTARAVTARKERAITIWHLVQRVDGAMRTRAYQGLQTLSPAPEGVTREGILALERPMLERWRRDLNPLWSEEAQPLLVRVARRLWDWTIH